MPGKHAAFAEELLQHVRCRNSCFSRRALLVTVFGSACCFIWRSGGEELLTRKMSQSMLLRSMGTSEPSEPAPGRALKAMTSVDDVLASLDPAAGFFEARWALKRKTWEPSGEIISSSRGEAVLKPLQGDASAPRLMRYEEDLDISFLGEPGMSKGRKTWIYALSADTGRLQLQIFSDNRRERHPLADDLYVAFDISSCSYGHSVTSGLHHGVNDNFTAWLTFENETYWSLKYKVISPWVQYISSTHYSRIDKAAEPVSQLAAAISQVNIATPWKKGSMVRTPRKTPAPRTPRKKETIATETASSTSEHTPRKVAPSLLTPRKTPRRTPGPMTQRRQQSTGSLAEVPWRVPLQTPRKTPRATARKRAQSMASVAETPWKTPRKTPVATTRKRGQGMASLAETPWKTPQTTRKRRQSTSSSESPWSKGVLTSLLREGTNSIDLQQNARLQEELSQPIQRTPRAKRILKMWHT
eukprot:gnl/TRDRNA2_/TRDRNA2_188054_c0_seq1.p1 gnl/TRDRNA2_/TRDRNA2_188054_c0~~gnl/TRDRNA2_/TRDRNA2_188054_c0_seq1.p1  ORF type:complete len:471 (+),score=54.15 gnl/TRDRNA2_/TRDRNA2_188054_c0_seq1:110-1522(+)